MAAPNSRTVENYLSTTGHRQVRWSFARVNSLTARRVFMRIDPEAPGTKAQYRALSSASRFWNVIRTQDGRPRNDGKSARYAFSLEMRVFGTPDDLRDLFVQNNISDIEVLIDGLVTETNFTSANFQQAIADEIAAHATLARLRNTPNQILWYTWEAIEEASSIGGPVKFNSKLGCEEDDSNKSIAERARMSVIRNLAVLRQWSSDAIATDMWVDVSAFNAKRASGALEPRRMTSIPTGYLFEPSLRIFSNNQTSFAEAYKALTGAYPADYVPHASRTAKKGLAIPGVMPKKSNELVLEPTGVLVRKGDTDYRASSPVNYGSVDASLGLVPPRGESPLGVIAAPGVVRMVPPATGQVRMGRRQ